VVEPNPFRDRIAVRRANLEARAIGLFSENCLLAVHTDRRRPTRRAYQPAELLEESAIRPVGISRGMLIGSPAP
jgi:hypothetical protein